MIFLTAKNLRLEDKEFCEELKIIRINKKTISIVKDNNE